MNWEFIVHNEASICMKTVFLNCGFHICISLEVPREIATLNSKLEQNHGS